MPATAGPIAAPIYSRSIVLPRIVPIDCLGVDKIIVFIEDMVAKMHPILKTARDVETSGSFK